MPATKPNVAALVEQMPETDKEIQARQAAAKPPPPAEGSDKPKPKADPWGAASKFTGPDPEAAEKIFTEILSGGRESILELLSLVREPSDADYKNYKAGYVLHGLVIYLGRAGQEKPRRLLTETVAAELAGNKHSNAVKSFFIRELRALGGKEVVNALGSQLLDDDLCSDATLALLTIRDGAAPHFRRALDKAKGKNRITIIQALGVLQDTAATGALKKALADKDPEVSRIASWSLANLGEASVAEALIKSADAAEGWERTQATKACLLLAERLTANGHNTQAARIYEHLRATRQDPTERHLRETAERALGTFTQ